MGKFKRLRAICAAATADGVVPGLAVVIGQEGQDLFTEAFGQRQTEGGTAAASMATVWDLASLTKALTTSLLCMQGVERGSFGLDDQLGRHVPWEGAERFTVRAALSHSTGLPAHRPFYREALPGGATPDASSRDAILAAAAREPLTYAAGTRSLYSDLGFMLLGDLLERRLRGRLDRLAERQLYAPLATQTLGFRPVGEAGAPAEIAATQRCPDRGRVLVGEVDDRNAYALGGVAGHAGLFGSAGDVAVLAHALCAAWRGAGLWADRGPLVDRDVLRTFWTPAGVPGSTWRLGWDGPAAQGSLAGDLISRHAVGHLAFTGCSLWIDPEAETFVVFLSNRVHPVARDDARFRDLRRAINDAGLEAAGYRS
jgi:CubicO group peptidase (beta-lactamase class C family)